MALSFSEKRGLQKNVQNHLAGLNGNPDFKTKRSLQKQLSDALARLGEKISSTLSLLDRFLEGEFTQASPLVFRDRLIEAAKALNGQISQLVEPFTWFMEYHEQNPVMESIPLDSQRFEELLALIKSGAFRGTLKMRLE